MIRIFLLLLLCLTITSCETFKRREARPYYKVGTPYQIDGQWYKPRIQPDYAEEGVASWYGTGFHGKKTANGDLFDENSLTAAHRTLPMPSMVRVTNMENGKSLEVMVNDRGPFSKGRIIDVSKRASQVLGFFGKGTARVRVEFLPDQTQQLLADFNLKPGDVASTEPVNNTYTEEPAYGSYEEVKIASLPSEAASSDSNPLDTGNFFVQAGAFSLKSNADKAAAKLAALGSVDVDNVVSFNTQDIYRVRLGPIAGRDKATEALQGVISVGYGDAIIVAQ